MNTGQILGIILLIMSALVIGAEFERRRLHLKPYFVRLIPSVIAVGYGSWLLS